MAERYGLEAEYSFGIASGSQKAMGTVVSQLNAIEQSVKSLGKQDSGVKKTLADISKGVKSVGKSSTQFSESTRQIDKQADALKALKKEFAALNSESKVIRLGTDKSAKAFDTATNQIRDYQRSLKGLQSQIEGTSTAERKLTADIERQIQGANKRIDMAVNQRQADAAKRQAEAAAQRQSTAMNVAATGAAISAPIIGIGVKATQGFANFKDSVSELKAISRSDAEGAARLEAIARDLGSSTRFSASEAVQGETFLAMSGFNEQQIGAAIKSTLDLASAGKFDDIAGAADVATNTLSAFKLAAEDTSRVVDVMALAAATSNTSVQQLGEAFAYAAPSAKDFGTTLEETAALTGAGGNIGIQGSAAGTALRSGLLALSNSAKQAKLQDIFGVEVVDPLTHANRNIIDIVGDLKASMSENFRDPAFAADLKKIQEDVAAGVIGADDQLAILQEKYPQYSAGLDGLAQVFGKTAVSFWSGQISQYDQLKHDALQKFGAVVDESVLTQKLSIDRGVEVQQGEDIYDALVRVTGDYTTAVDLVNAATNELIASGQGGLGAGAAMAKEMEDNLAGSFRSFGSAFESLQFSFIAPLEPLIRSTVEALISLIRVMTSLPDSVKQIISFGLGLTAVFGVLLTVAGGIGVAFFGIQSALAAAGTAIASYGAASGVAATASTGLMGAATTALSAIASAVAPVIAGIAAITAAAYLLYRAFDSNFLGIASLTKAAFTNVTAFVSQFVVELSSAFAPVLQSLQQAWADISTAVQGAFAPIGQLINSVTPGLQGIVSDGSAAKALAVTIAAPIRVVAEIIAGIVSAIAAITTGIVNIAGIIITAVTLPAQGVVSTIQLIADTIKSTGEVVYNALVEPAGLIVQAWGGVTAAINPIFGIVSGLAQQAIGSIGAVVEALSGVTAVVLTAAVPAFQLVVGTVGDLLSQVNVTGSAIYEAMVTPVAVVQSAWQTFIGGFAALVSPIFDSIGAIGLSFTGLASLIEISVLPPFQVVVDAVATMLSTVNAIGTAIYEAMIVPVETVRGAWQGFTDGFGGVLEPVVGTAGHVAQGLINMLNHNPTVVIPIAWANAAGEITDTIQQLPEKGRKVGGELNKALTSEPVKATATMIVDTVTKKAPDQIAKLEGAANNIVPFAYAGTEAEIPAPSPESLSRVQEVATQMKNVVLSAYAQMTTAAASFGLVSLLSVAPLPLVLGAIALAVIGVSLNFLGLRTIVSGIGQVAVGVFLVVKSIFSTVFQLVRSLGAVIEAFGAALRGDFSRIGPAFQGVKAALMNGLNQIGNAGRQILGGLLQMGQGVGQGIRQVLSPIFNRFTALKNVATNAATLISEAWSRVTAVIDKVGDRVSQASQKVQGVLGRIGLGKKATPAPNVQGQITPEITPNGVSQTRQRVVMGGRQAQTLATQAVSEPQNFSQAVGMRTAGRAQSLQQGMSVARFDERVSPVVAQESMMARFNRGRSGQMPNVGPDIDSLNRGRDAANSLVDSLSVLSPALAGPLMMITSMGDAFSALRVLTNLETLAALRNAAVKKFQAVQSAIVAGYNWLLVASTQGVAAANTQAAIANSTFVASLQASSVWGGVVSGVNAVMAAGFGGLAATATAAWAAITGPLLPILVGIGAIAGAVALLYLAFKNGINPIKPIISSVMDVARQFWAIFRSGVVESALSVVTAFREQVKRVGDAFKDAVAPIAQVTQTAVSGLIKMIALTIDFGMAIGRAVGAVGNTIILTMLWIALAPVRVLALLARGILVTAGGILTAVAAIVGLLVNIALAPIRLIFGIVAWGAQLVRVTLGGAIAIVGGVIATINEQIVRGREALSAAIAPVKELWAAIRQLFAPVSKGVENLGLIPLIATVVLAPIKLIAKILQWAIRLVGSGLVGAIKLLGVAIKVVVTPLIKVVEVLGLIKSAVVNTIYLPFTLVRGVVHSIHSSVNGLAQAFNHIGEVLKAALLAPFQMVWQAIQMIGGYAQMLLGKLPFIGRFFQGPQAQQAAPPEQPKGYATGGFVQGPGTGKSDSIAALLSNREYVVNANATQANRPFLDAMNFGGLSVPGFLSAALSGATAAAALSAPPISFPPIPSAQAIATANQQAAVINLDAPISIQFGDIVVNGDRPGPAVQDEIIKAIDDPMFQVMIKERLADLLEKTR